MFFAICGIIILLIGACTHSNEAVISGAGFLAFDIVLELVNLKNQLYYIGVAIRNTLLELKEKNEST